MNKTNVIKPRLGGAQYRLEKKRKCDELNKLASFILREHEYMKSFSYIFNTLYWLEQKGMLNEKSITAFLKYNEKEGE